MSKIALICLPNAPALPSWPWEIRVLPDHLFHAAAVVSAWVEHTDSEYVLFWDMALGQPDPEACLQMLEKPGEGWHAGLLLGHAGQPSVLNHLNPTWLLHLDVPAEIASDSWKLSLRAALLKTEIIRKTGVFRADFSNFEAAGLEWGYRMQAAGALLRHEPKLLRSTPMQMLPGFSVQDSLSFVALHFPKKWYWWTVFRLLARGTKWSQTGAAVWRTRSKKRLKITLLPRPIEPEILAFKPEDWQKKVSVLMPTLNRYPYAINSIEQLKRQTVHPLEILSTDQTDSENRWEDFAGQYPEVRVFPQNEKGQCIAWNKLLDESTAPYVLFLGDDADGISLDFLANMCRTMAHYQADMVASHVIEIGGAADPYGERVVKLTDTFPITLIRRELVFRAGKMDMAFNKGIRADHDLAIRCRMLGAHMIFDSSLRILHHRAPVGGLRWHQQRVLTRHISKISPFKIQYPAESEYYLFRKHFSTAQRREYAYILMLSQLLLEGSALKKMLRAVYFLLNLPKIWARYARLWRNA